VLNIFEFPVEAPTEPFRLKYHIHSLNHCYAVKAEHELGCIDAMYLA
jgi:hypothetical protein